MLMPRLSNNFGAFLLVFAGVSPLYACNFPVASVAHLTQDRVCFEQTAYFQACSLNDHPQSREISRIYLQSLLAHQRNHDIAGHDEVDNQQYRQVIKSQSKSFVGYRPIHYQNYNYRGTNYVCAYAPIYYP